MIITTNKNTLKDRAIIQIGQGITSKIKTEGDFTIIYSGPDEIIGINIDNYKTHFNAQEGTHIINKEQQESLKKFNFKRIPMFHVGEVTEIKPHPKSDRLFLLKVRTTKDLNIVTNIKTLKLNQKIIIANIGSILPSGSYIKRSKVVGVESEGMICSEVTLGAAASQDKISKLNTGDEFIF